jgi:glutaredoxin-like protein
MGFLSERDQKLVRERLAEMKEPVKLLHFTQTLNCETCLDAQKLLEEVAALSDKLRLEMHNPLLEKELAARYGIDKVPATVIEGERDYGIRLYGLPAGYEFAVLLEDILQVSQRASGLEAASVERLKALRQAVHLEVLVTPTCPYCPTAARLAHQLAIESEWITADLVEAAEYSELVQRYRVRGVPKTVINGRHFVDGAVPEEELIEQILQAAGVRPAQREIESGVRSTA